MSNNATMPLTAGARQLGSCRVSATGWLLSAYLLPASDGRKLPARLPLHGDVILMQLLDNRHPVQAIDSTHCTILLWIELRRLYNDTGEQKISNTRIPATHELLRNGLSRSSILSPAQCVAFILNTLCQIQEEGENTNN